ncbi:hypothetical protein GS438_01245 [Rhodococcus hoagii]|nr:hypothetical protein [Prescottella equi]
MLTDGDLDRLVRGEETGLHEQSQRRGGRILARTDLVEHDPRCERVAAEVQIDQVLDDVCVRDVPDLLTDRLNRLDERVIQDGGEVVAAAAVEVQEVSEPGECDLLVVVLDRLMHVGQVSLHAEQLHRLPVRETDTGVHAAAERGRDAMHLLDLGRIVCLRRCADRDTHAVSAGRRGLDPHELVLEQPMLVGGPQDRLTRPHTGPAFAHVRNKVRHRDRH